MEKSLKQNLTIIGVITILGLGLFAISHPKKPTVIVPTKMCFTRNTEDGGTANIVMSISGDAVMGTFDYKPAQKDSKTGSFVGKISSGEENTRVVSAVWNASAEGRTAREELKIIIGTGIATPGFGVMKEGRDDIEVYADPQNISYDMNLSLINCETESVR